MDTALSIRAAATAAEVTEKTIRRWIKSGRLHAVKLGGQYRIMPADLTQAYAEPVRPVDTARPDSGPAIPQVDMGGRGDNGPGAVQSEPSPSVDLAPLVAHIAQLEAQVQRLTESSTAWQFRALQAEERVKQLTAGDDDVTAAPTAEVMTPAPQAAPSEPPSVWRRLRHWLRGSSPALQ